MVSTDITGNKYGRLTVIALHSHGSRNPWSHTKWLCRCDCGNEIIVARGNLTTGNTQSCGCLYKETRYGAFVPNDNRLYNSWRAMKARCNNPNNNRYYAYGARGIKVCPEWESYPNFKKWALENGYSKELTIDRIDNDGNYEPANCRWVAPEEQSKHRRCVKK